MRRRPNFTSTYRGVNARLAHCLISVLNVKLVGAFNQEGEGPVRGLLRDCEIFANLRLKLYLAAEDGDGERDEDAGAEEVHHALVEEQRVGPPGISIVISA